MRELLYALLACCFFILAGAGPAAASADTAADPGIVVIVAANGQTHNPGDPIAFLGTNTGSGTTYLFITGPNLPENGSRIRNADPQHWPVTDGDASTFQEAGVGSDNRWSWTWDTRGTALAPGIYTVYAVSRPCDKAHLASAHYGTTSIVLAEPGAPATVQQADVAQGETIRITGRATGSPGPGVAVWVIGPLDHGGHDTADYADRFLVQPDLSGSFSLELNGTITRSLNGGDYHVLVQYPGTNNDFEIIPAGADGGVPGNGDVWVWNKRFNSSPDDGKLFKIRGAGSLQGIDAYEALIGAFDASVDDRIPVSADGKPDPVTFHVIDLSPGTSFREEELASDPPGDVVAGTPETITFSLGFPGTGDETFPSSHDLVMTTDLDNPRWASTLVLDGVKNQQPETAGRAMTVTDWVLSYPPTVRESVNVTLKGTVPPLASRPGLTLFNVTEYDESGLPTGAPFQGYSAFAGSPAAPDTAVTIALPANRTWVVGNDSLAFSGTSTASKTTYLFVTGPGLKNTGAQIQSTHPADSPVIDGDESTFLAVRVGNDNRWSYTWDTQNVRISSGTYTVYAVSSPRDFADLKNTHFARISFRISSPQDEKNGGSVFPTGKLPGQFVGERLGQLP